ncbi:11991_t:CDS:2 [Dentiscutata erythropus]|uniref:11991_t:CDS:1 n=1 Tax=Dentiscutata erythropus TaxID=1348616 RepID=A0A9N9IMC4_9GLOM|nr:11991_t:CDS:2 [Dentiscutata erythropus]
MHQNNERETSEERNACLERRRIRDQLCRKRETSAECDTQRRKDTYRQETFDNSQTQENNSTQEQEILNTSQTQWLHNPGGVPIELQGLTEMEEILIAQVFPVMSVYNLRDVLKFTTRLPHHPLSLEIMVVRWQSKDESVFKDFNESQEIAMLGSDFEPYTKTLNNARVVFGATVAIGRDNFESIIDDRLTFVDKSMLIKEFIKSSDLVSLVLRPRRFGKSTNLSMLHRFFEILQSQDEKIIRKKLFEKLKISAEIEIMKKHFAQYPDSMPGTWNDMITQLRVLVAEIYEKHHYLINHLDPYAQKRYQRILERDQTYPVSELSFALQELSE